MDCEYETFVENHLVLPDEVLLQKRDKIIKTPVIFTMIYNASISNTHISVETLSKIIAQDIRNRGNHEERKDCREKMAIVSVNSNFTHESSDGFEFIIAEKIERKEKKDEKKERDRIRNNTVKKQRVKLGDGIGFSSEVEISIHIPELKESPYYVKVFCTQGVVQIPGVISEDYVDAKIVLQTLVDYLNYLKIGDLDETTGMPKKIEVITQSKMMANYKTILYRSSPRIILNVMVLGEYFVYLSNKNIYQRSSILDIDVTKFVEVPLDGKLVSASRPQQNTVVIVRVERNNSKPQIKFFQSCKINILGAKNDDDIQVIQNYIRELFMVNWDHFIGIKPRKDSDIKPIIVPKVYEPKLITMSDLMRNITIDDQQLCEILC